MPGGSGDMSARVMDLMSYPVLTVPPNAKVIDAIRLMASGPKGCVIVAEGGLLKEVKGIVTTSRIFKKVFAAGLDPANVSVADIMTPAPLVTISPEATTREAAELMVRHNIRRLPVVQDGALVGIITSKDLLRCVK